MSFDWITDEMFNHKLDDLIHRTSMAEILAMGGVYDIIREELNNEVIDHLSEIHNRCDLCGSELDDENDCKERCCT